MMRRASVMAVMTVAISTVALAGLLTSPAPDFPGGSTGQVVYRLGPVHHEPGAVETLITCSSLGESRVEVAVDVFDAQDQATGVVTRASLPAHGTVTFTTAADAQGDVAILGLPTFQNGKARVSATSADLSCAGKHRLRTPTGETKEAPVELIKKVARSS